MEMIELGWRDFFAKQVQPSGLRPARVTACYGEEFFCENDHGQLVCERAGKMMYQESEATSSVTVGDWVWLTPAYEGRNGDRRALIQAVLERQSKISRAEPGKGGRREQLIAANVDYVFVVSSLNEDLNFARLDRYVAASIAGAASPIILLTKLDLANQGSDLVELVKRRFSQSVPVIAVSVKDGIGLDALDQFFEIGKTSVLVGSSGVGKSTLVNHLLAGEKQAVQSIGFKDKGRHTTSHREVFFLPHGGVLIDTPGLREFGLVHHDAGVSSVFDAIEVLATHCRYSNCSHTTEDGCTIKQAIYDGVIEADKVKNFIKLQRESTWNSQRHDKAWRVGQKKIWKTRTKQLRQKKKLEV